jgi:hypothetical protein
MRVMHVVCTEVTSTSKVTHMDTYFYDTKHNQGTELRSEEGERGQEHSRKDVLPHIESWGSGDITR